MKQYRFEMIINLPIETIISRQSFRETLNDAICNEYKVLNEDERDIKHTYINFEIKNSGGDE